MGNCLEGNKKGGAVGEGGGGTDKSAIGKDQIGTNGGNSNDGKSARGNKSSIHSIHGGILRERKIDVYQKYREVAVLGSGSMGHVAKVEVREGEEGGSAYRYSTSVDSSLNGGVKSKNKPKNVELQPTTSSLSERKRHHIDFALKSIQLERVSPTFVEELKNEIEILKTMDHPNIVRLHEVYYHKKQIYMILELCDGGDLYTRLPYTEKNAAYITGKLLSAVKYMHDHGIVHRDLKFENVMFENSSPEAEVKVIDFGLSKKFANDKIGLMHEGVGTLYSMAPQVLQGVYTSQADMWSVGVITYMLLSSHRPFYNKKRKVMIDRIMRCDYTFEKDYWNPVSDEAKDFISHLLVLDPKVRYKAEQAQKHKWMHKEFKLEDRAPNASISERVAGNLMFYKDTAALKKIALNVIAHRSSTNEIYELRKAFDQFDTANNGIISFDEFKEALKDKYNYTDEDIKEMFDSIDVNQNGHIMYTEFIAATLEAHGNVEEERIAEAFDRLDCDDSGFISKQNLLDFLGEGGTMEDVEDMIRSIDADNDGQISFQEFLKMFRSQKSERILKTMETDVSVPSDMDSSSLVGLDAHIPGGKFDSNNTSITE